MRTTEQFFQTFKNSDMKWEVCHNLPNEYDHKTIYCIPYMSITSSNVNNVIN